MAMKLKIYNHNLKSIPIKKDRPKIEVVESNNDYIVIQVNSEDDFTEDDYVSFEGQDIDVFDDGTSIVWYSYAQNKAFLLLDNGRRFDENPFTKGTHTFYFEKEYFNPEYVSDSPDSFSFVCNECGGKAIYNYEEDVWICESCGYRYYATAEQAGEDDDVIENCNLW